MVFRGFWVWLIPVIVLAGTACKKSSPDEGDHLYALRLADAIALGNALSWYYEDKGHAPSELKMLELFFEQNSDEKLEIEDKWEIVGPLHPVVGELFAREKLSAAAGVFDGNFMTVEYCGGHNFEYRLQQ